MCYEAKDFKVGELRAAVEYLRSIPGADAPDTFVGAIADAVTVQAGPFKLKPQPMLRLSEILGKTPAQVWDLFDRMVDKLKDGLTTRGQSAYKR